MLEGKAYVMTEAEAEMLLCKLRKTKGFQQPQKLGERWGRILRVSEGA